MQVRDERSAPSRLLDHLDQHRGGWWAHGLAPLGWLYAQGSRALRGLRPDRPLDPRVPSVGVGNLRVGGTGKTPVVADLVIRLRERGLRVAVLTRGYRAGDGADEPGWLDEQGAWVEVDADRHRGFTRLLERGVDVVLLDDALQTRHRPRETMGLMLARDLDRAPRPLPAGPAREWVLAACQRAGLWAARHDGGFDPRWLEWNEYAGRPLLHFRLRPLELERLRDGHLREVGDPPEGPALLVSGLARPESFELDVSAAGLPGVGAWRFEDHWAPTGSDLRRLVEDARRLGATWMLAPEKNAARLRRLGDADCPIWALRSEVEWAGPSPLEAVPTWFSSRLI